MLEPHCNACGCGMDWVDCWSGCDDGYFDAYEDDPINCFPGEVEECGNCGGKGGWWRCLNSKCDKGEA
jgi:hypothetical protein